MDETLRQSGIEIIDDVPWGTHFCQFYQTRQDLLDILLPYFKTGLEHNEFCMWVACEPLSAKEALEAFRQYLPGLDRYRATGQLEIIPHTDWYLKGGGFDSQRVLNGWVEKLDRARAQGFDGLRLTGNTFWLEKKDWKDFVAYEEEVNHVIGQYRMIALCTYSVDGCSAAKVIDVVSNHQFALSKRDGKWALIESSEHKRAMEAVKASEAKYRSLFDNMIDGFAYHRVVTDAAGKPADYVFLEVNSAFEQLTGLKGAEIIGRGAREALPGIEKDPADWIGVYGRVALTGKEARFERYSAQLGKWYSVLAYSPKQGYFVTVFEDITERKRAEEALRRSYEELEQRVQERTVELTRSNEELETEIAERLQAVEDLRRANAYNRSLIEASLDPLVTIDAGGKITDVNLATQEATGLSRSELIGTDFSSYFTEPEKAQAGYRQVFREGSVKDYPLEIRHRSGGSTPVLYNATVYRDEAGKVLGVFAAARDITERRETERRITVTNDLLKLYTRKFSHKEYLDVAVELVRAWSGCRHIGVRIVDEQGNIPYEACAGYNPEFLSSENDLSLANDQCICIRVIAGTPEFRERAAMTPHGTFYCNDTTKFVSELTDKQKTQYRAVCMQHGYTSLAVVPIRHRERIIGAVHVADERPGMVPARNVEFIEQLSFIIGEAIVRFGIEEELRQLNRELEHRVADRTAQLEAANRELEAFAYSVSHDLRSPLRSIDGFSHAILEDYAPLLDDTGRGYFERVRAAAGKMGQLIDALLNLSRLTRGELNRASIDLSPLATAVAEDLKRAEPGRRAEFVIGKKVVAEGDAVMLRVVVENLLSNAWKFTAKREAARIEFGTFECTLHSRDALVNAGVNGMRNAESGMKSPERCGQGKTVYFVRDNGAGFDMAYAGKLFSAFQRLHSREEFPGLGIGLATVQRIIHRHGGTLWAEGEIGKGATFYFTLQGPGQT